MDFWLFKKVAICLKRFFALQKMENGLLKTEKFSLLLEFIILTNSSYR